MYEISLWCSDRKLGNDDCITGAEFDNYEAAFVCMKELTAAKRGSNPYWQHAYIDKDGVEIEHIQNPTPRVEPDDHSAENSERIGLAAMEGGVDAYNEAIGSPLDEEETPGFRM